MRVVDAPGLLLWSDLGVHDFLELVELADASGYSELWYTDIRFQHDCYMGLALAAAHSRRLLLGPGVSDPYSRHPALIAMAMASLDEVSGGRAQLGLGTGGGGLAEMRLTQERPVRALREAIELVREMLEGRSVDYGGELFHLHGGRLGFTPIRPRIPTFVATHSPQVLRLCGRVADGVLLANMGRRSAVEGAVALLRRSEREAGRAPHSVAVHLRLETCISDDEDGALDVVRRRFAARLVNSFPRWHYLEGLGVHATETMRDAAARKDTAAVADELSNDDVRSTALAGSVQTVADQVLTVLGPDIRKVTIRPLAVPGQSLTVTIGGFIEHVWPRVLDALHARETPPGRERTG